MNTTNSTPPGVAGRKSAVLSLLRDGAWHTQKELITTGGPRFGGVISALRKEGWDIETGKLSANNTNSYGYRLTSAAPTIH